MSEYVAAEERVICGSVNPAPVLEAEGVRLKLQGINCNTPYS